MERMVELDELYRLAEENPLSGRRVAVQGPVGPYTWEGVCAAITAVGGFPVQELDEGTDYLLCDVQTSREVERAEQFGVVLLTPEQFFNLLNQ